LLSVETSENEDRWIRARTTICSVFLLNQYLDRLKSRWH